MLQASANPAIVHMYVTVEQVSRSELFHQLIECIKSLMGKILQITPAPGGGMGHQNVQSPVEQYPGYQTPFSPRHFLLAILVLS